MRTHTHIRKRIYMYVRIYLCIRLGIPFILYLFIPFLAIFSVCSSDIICSVDLLAFSPNNYLRNQYLLDLTIIYIYIYIYISMIECVYIYIVYIIYSSI